MADLRVTIGGDSTQYQAELAKVKAEAAKTGAQISAQAKKQSQSTGKLAARGMQLGNAASAASGFLPPAVASGLNLVSSSFVALQEVSTGLGVGLLKAAGAAGIFAATAFALTKLGSEIIALRKAVNQETKSGNDEYAVRRTMREKYDKAILEAQSKGQITAEKATALRVGLRSNDASTVRKAAIEARGFANGPDKDLVDQFRKAMVESMAEGRGKEIAKANLEFEDAKAALDEKRSKAGQVDKQLIDILIQQLVMKLKTEVAGINAKFDKTKEPAKTKAVDRSLRRAEDSMASLGLYTGQYLRSGSGLEDTAKKQLDVMRAIEKNTKGNGSNPFV